jgi:putative acetyltransferase
MTSTAVEILSFAPEYRDDFKRLNAEWMHHFYGKNVEAYLDIPEEKVLQNGGFILFARKDNQIIGTCAVLKSSSKTFEIANIAVSPAYRGKGIGKQLLIEAIDDARHANARQISLTTSSQFKISLELFKTFGFREAGHDAELSKFDNTDVRMVLSLK